MVGHAQLLRRVADGECHSGETLAADLKMTRAGIWKLVRKLRDRGINIEAHRGQGYRLSRPIDLLDEQEILGLVNRETRQRIESLQVHLEVDSTNRRVAEVPPSGPGCLVVCMAEFQTQGRGRRGRCWNAPLGSGICLSTGWKFRETPRDLGALALAAGVAVRRALNRSCALEVDLKWPNDIVWGGRKLGGILVEFSAESQGACSVVIGVGINVDVPDEVLAGLSDWASGAADIATATDGPLPARSAIAAALIDELGTLLGRFDEDGFAATRDEWRQADFLRGKHVQLTEASGQTSAMAEGIADNGELLLRLPDGALKHVVSGDVSVRAAS